MSKAPGTLNRKLTFALYGVLTITSLIFIALLVGAYQLQLKNERSKASAQLNLLLGATLENAMLKRDLPGLQGVIDRLAAQPDVETVFIINPKGEVRFSSEREQVGQMLTDNLSDLCDGCAGDFRTARITTRFLESSNGKNVLRSVNPVHNQTRCAQCHGAPAKNPVNGLLIVDYDATPILQHAKAGLAGLMLGGFLIMLLALITVWWFLRQHVIHPVHQLKQACEHLSQGDLAIRSTLQSSEEFGSLSDSFNRMAERLENSLSQLLEKEAYLQALIDAIPDGIRVLDENFRTINANRALQKLLKRPEPIPVGEPCYKTSYHQDTPCPPTLITCPVHEIAKHGQAIKTMHEYETPDEHYAKVQVFAAPMEIELEGKKQRFVVESIRDLMRDIQFSHEHKLSALGQLAAGVSHEIRNPLTSIRLALDSALKKLHIEKDIDPDIVEYLSLVDGEIDRCLDVTSRLLKMSALAGEDLQIVDINLAVRETVSLVHYEAQLQQLHIDLQLDEREPRCIATETDVRMLILNLVQNAFHALPKQGRMQVTTELIDDAVRISVADNGAGISDADLPHIFEPFFTHRADGKKGIGLGLTISQSIVQRQEGLISVERYVDGFSTRFIVVLPIVKA